MPCIPASRRPFGGEILTLQPVGGAFWHWLVIETIV